jgi:hypothetical protein
MNNDDENYEEKKINNKSTIAIAELLIINDKLYKSFKKAYILNKDREMYKWENHDFLTKYSYYMIEHINAERKRRGLKIFKVRVEGKWE